jgi:hypothetical protein
MLVISSSNTLQVFVVPDDDLGTTTLLLVTDAGKSGLGAVHVIDVVHGTHVGYVAAPGTIDLPRTVATRKSLAAVVCFDVVVRVFEGSGASWTAVRAIASGCNWSSGLRFTADGARLVVADYGRCDLSIFCAKDGAFLRHMDLPPGVCARDVEECDSDGGSIAGWVVCHFGGLLAVADNNANANAATCRRNLDSCHPLALARLTGLGLVVRLHSGDVRFLATPDAVAMAAMSSCKVAWMVAVCRGLFFCPCDCTNKMDILALVPLPIRMSPEFCKLDAGGGTGVAVCQDLGLLVISCCNKLQVFALPEDIASGTPRDLAHVRTLGGVAPMEFQFNYSSGFMAFADGCRDATSGRLLLLTDFGKSGFGAVHVIDVLRGAHVGYVATPGTIMWPESVTSRNSQAAVSCCNNNWPVVCVFEGSGASNECTWTPVRVIAVGFDWLHNLRFSADGSRLVGWNVGDGRLSMFCAKNGSFLRHMALVKDKLLHESLVDVEECEIRPEGDGGRAGMVICHSSGLVAVSGTNEKATRRDLDLNCHALALMPGLGLLVVRHDTGVQFFATPDAVAMAAMSFCKVAWMAAVFRGFFIL